MELFYSWSLEEAYTGFLVQYDSRVLPKVYDCLVAPSVKPAVVSRIFDIVESLLAASFDNRGICDTVVQPHISLLLSNLSALVERTKDVSTVATPMAQRQINILSEIAQYCTDASQASTLFGLFAPTARTTQARAREGQGRSSEDLWPAYAVDSWVVRSCFGRLPDDVSTVVAIVPITSISFCANRSCIRVQTFGVHQYIAASFICAAGIIGRLFIEACG
jgi:hypothetical protein